MSIKDFIDLSIGNLWLTKLRAFLTISGVVIAIAAFTSLLSFGAGNQKYVMDAYNELGLFTTMNVYPDSDRDNSDIAKSTALDKKAIENLSKIPGVVLAYPFNVFQIDVFVADTHVTTKARALPDMAVRTKYFDKILAGHTFTSDTASEVILTHKFLDLIDVHDPDSLIGQEMIISAKSISLDSGLINIIDDKKSKIWDRFKAIHVESLYIKNYRQQIMRREFNEGLRRFVDGLITRQVTIKDTLRILGVGKDLSSYNLHLAPLIISEKTARRLTSEGLIFGNDPVSLISTIRSGNLFDSEKAEEEKSYPQATLQLKPMASHEAVIDSVEALGFKAFSYAEAFKNIQRMFLYFNAGLAIIGLIALVTAALGIVNTMLMSIIERRKEIGIIKSLGADEGQIRLLFLVESGVIGSIGSSLGILCGWGATRIVSAILKVIMEREGMLVFEPFDFPLWLMLFAFLFGLVVSLSAGFYPASRAARVDPVIALRNE